MFILHGFILTLPLPNSPDEYDDDDDLLNPETAHLLPRDSSSESLTSGDNRDASAAANNHANAVSSTSSSLQRRHCHAPVPIGRERTKAKIQLIVTSVLCFLFMMGEIAGTCRGEERRGC